MNPPGASPQAPPVHESVRTGTSIESLRLAILDNLFFVQGRFPEVATANDWYQAVAYTVRDRLLKRWVATARNYKEQGSRTVAYLSAEFLIGPQLANNLFNLGLYDHVNAAVAQICGEHGTCPTLPDLFEQEPEPGLGNGGLGRLAACYLDSMATLRIPAIGYGIRYEFGIFNQEIRDGWQVEVGDNWLSGGNPWEIARPKLSFDIPLGGHVEHFNDTDGHHVRWVPEQIIRGVAYDTPISGYGVDTVNLLRLWKSEAPQSFDFAAFNTGDYWRAVEEKVVSETVSKVLYPNDEPVGGKRLRLTQQFFFVSCSLQDMIRLHQQREGTLDGFHEKFVAQLNDTHPALAIPELMRLLVDMHDMDWDRAWHITRKTFAYTNHTLLPEALEVWPLELFKRLLPRHLEIIYEINARFLDEVRLHFRETEDGHLRRMSLIGEENGKSVRMANLACVGSFAINGVAELHTELLKSSVLRDFHEMWPDKISNKTNGVTPRRFLLQSNPNIAMLMRDHIGCQWAHELETLNRLGDFAGDADFRIAWRETKQAAKQRLATIVERRLGERIDTESMFDVQAKRIHEYKRPHLNLLHVISLYNRLKANPNLDAVPRTVIFAGKAAPGYQMAKLIIKLIHAVAETIDRDRDVRDRLKVVFFPNFNVKNAQLIYPAADLSEQISTAGLEASGTGNMKFAMNGALTIGTLDGANIEIRREVGEENFFLFGLTADEVAKRIAAGYVSRHYYDANPEMREAIDLIARGYFSHGDRDLFRPVVDELLGRDKYLVLADYADYLDAQSRVDLAYRDRDHWTRMSVLNVARMGHFSSDRSVRDYNREIWHADPAVLPTGK
ncbi:MAG: glycogen/starch/alpha-glucan phosphorylase [Gammaproteobacteria bacterium]|nr:glycogen/starch/alpha-glucan phosphorylase [Gammaproteobacteria bacterium]MCP5137544.1 glycogen/starch/alpha-glucan phosphorylase [Gammaproteobacteria bacterium]